MGLGESGRILIAGDLFPMSRNVRFFETADISSLFGEELVQMFASANYAICNLEGAFTDHDERGVKTGPLITAPTRAVRAFKALGIDCCALANNHITDGGHQGVLDTMKALKDAGIAYVGAGLNQNEVVRSLFFEVCGMKFCLYNVCERMYNKPTESRAGAWLYDEYLVCKELAEIKSKCDYLIVIYHGGIERFRYPSPEIKKRFHRMADNGADMVLSQHTHCIGCEEYYNGSYLLYGQGDFLLNNFRPEITDTGIVLELDVDENGIDIQKHLVRCSSELSLNYIAKPDFSAFDDRSGKVQDDVYLKDQFQQFSKEELRLYLTAFKSPGRLMRIIKKYFPDKYMKWLYTRAFSRRDLLFSLHTLRSEQNRETAIMGIESLLDDMSARCRG